MWTGLIMDRWQLQYIREDVDIRINDACEWCQKYHSTHSEDHQVIDKVSEQESFRIG
jgi:hypothetical protein